MNPALTYGLIGAAVGWFRSRTKRGRPVSALMWGVGTTLLVGQVLPRMGVNLPRLGA